MTTGANGGPANLLALNVGGISVNYDLGPSTATVASQAYSFLGKSFDNDTSLLNGAIAGANKMVTGITSPVIALATDQQNFNTTQLPTMFAQVENQNFQIAQSAQQVQAQTAESSIAASNAEAANAPKGGGGCYITTAVCESLGLPDDNYLLRRLRQFRDGWMARFRPGEVLAYYDSAPRIVEVILAMDDSKAFLRRVLSRYLWPALKALDEGREYHAYLIYKGMVADLSDVLRPLQRETFDGR